MAQNNTQAMIKNLPEWCWQLNEYGTSQIVVYHNTLERLEKSLDADFADEEGYTPLYNACRAGFDEVIKLLLDYGADIEYKNSEYDLTPIFLVGLDHDRPTTMQLMIDRGADLNHQSTYGETPLLIMIDQEHWDCAEVLFNAGADPHLNTMNGKTALSVALKVKNPPDILLRMIAKWQGEDLKVGYDLPTQEELGRGGRF